MREKTEKRKIEMIPISKRIDNLWDHQIEAIKEVQRYIKAYWNNRVGIKDKSALVNMPTGSGKSGIIAVLARCIPYIGLTVVLTPRISLRNQLYRDIQWRFFTHIKHSSDNLPKTIQKVEKSSKLVLADSPDNLVVVMTIQMLKSLFKGRKEIFKLLSEQTSLLIVDEGHYEPAFEWSKIIRKIKAPKVIFTATPYRNDLKVFDVHSDYIYILTFQEALNGDYLRKVRVIERPSKMRMSPKDFVNDTIDFYNSTFSHSDKDPPRVIIRCDDSASIRHLAMAFRRRRKSVIGIHDTFKETDGWEHKRVPDPKEEEAIFWIHQFKLLEGIDDSRFQVLAIYEKIRTGRSLVQQVGRIIRNPRRLKGEKAYFLEHWDGHHTELWDQYLRFDIILKKIGFNAFFLSTGRGFLNKLIENQPKISYVEGRFRSEFEFKNIKPEEDIQLPLKVNLFEKPNNFDIDKFVNNIKNHYKRNDRIVEDYEVPNKVHIIISIRCSSNRFLRNHIFMEADLHVTIIQELQEYICLYDSSGLSWITLREFEMAFSLKVEKMKRLFNPGRNAKLTRVSLKNSNLGTSSIRSRTIIAKSIKATVPGFDDYAQICTIAEGYTPGSVRRYVGFSRGRVSDTISGYVPLSKYLIWLKKIQDAVESGKTTLSVLSRYSLETKVPAKPFPRSILLDLGDIEESYVLVKDEDQLIEIEDTCANVENGKFKIIANNQEIEVEIKFDNNRYYLTSCDLDSLYICKSESFPKSIVRYFNKMQSFLVLPEDLTTIYVSGQFYSPAMKIGSKFNVTTYELGNCFITDETIGNCASEKGNATYYQNHTDNWDPNSLFGIISRLGDTTNVSSEFGDPTFIICDDAGIEIADFLLCTIKPPKVVFIHAKASSTRYSCSASNLHDVCAQTVKNLGYLAMFNNRRPSKLNSWDGPWTAKVDGGTGTVEKRIHKPESIENGPSIWRKIRRIINNPMVDKDVWLFLGNFLSKNYFETELAKNNPKPHVIQAAYLLHATMTDVASVGGKLRIFCKA